MSDFIVGCIAMACFVAGLFFLRFWWDTRDRLFIMFAAAFWIFAASRFAVIYISTSEDAPLFVYWGRLVAFLLILIAIVDKNRSRGKD